MPASRPPKHPLPPRRLLLRRPPGSRVRGTSVVNLSTPSPLFRSPHLGQCSSIGTLSFPTLSCSCGNPSLHSSHGCLRCQSLPQGGRSVIPQGCSHRFGSLPASKTMPPALSSTHGTRSTPRSASSSLDLNRHANGGITMRLHTSRGRPPLRQPSKRSACRHLPDLRYQLQPLPLALQARLMAERLLPRLMAERLLPRLMAEPPPPRWGPQAVLAGPGAKMVPPRRTRTTAPPARHGPTSPTPSPPARCSTPWRKRRPGSVPLQRAARSVIPPTPPTTPPCSPTPTHTSRGL